MIATLASRALAIVDLPDRKLFLEKEIKQGFHFRRVEILLKPEGPERYASESIRVRNLLGSNPGDPLRKQKTLSQRRDC